MPFHRDRPIRLQPYFGYRNTDRLRISARALRTRPTTFEGTGRWQAIRTMIAQFASHEISGLPVTMTLKSPGGEARHAQASTDAEGFVHFDVKLDGWALPETPQWEAVQLSWSEDERELAVAAYLLAPGASTSIGVISDIDDTIIETGITGNLRAVLRNWNRVLAQFPDERIVVPGADSFYGALGGAAQQEAALDHIGTTMPTATQRPFFYVSSSPWNLFSYLVAFKKLKGLPLGPVALRDWGLNRATFGGSSHGAHKADAIDRILATYPDMHFALIGDDTQGDLTAFGDVVSLYGKRIAAVFIRTSGEAMSKEEEAAKSAIHEAGVPLWLGPDYATGLKFLDETGLAADGGAREVVNAKVEAGQ